MRAVLIFFLLPLLLGAQSREIDSLKVVLKSAPDDTAKVNKLNYMNKLMWQLGDFNQCLENGLETLTLAEKLNYPQGIAAACGNIGIAQRHLGSYSKALEYYFRALQIDEQLGDELGRSKRLNNIGLVYLETGNADKALEYYFKALAIDEKLKNEKGKATRLANIGSVYDSQEKNQLALQYYMKALEIDQRRDDRHGIARDYGNIGNLYAALADSAQQRGNTLFAQVRYDMAASFFQKALKIYEAQGDQDGVATYTGNLGLYHLTMGRYAQAEQYLKKALPTSRSISALGLIKDQEQSLSILYERTGRPGLALAHYKEYIAARDSIFNEENTRKQVRAEMNFEFEKKETAAKLEQDKKNAVAAAESRRQRIILIAISGFGLLVLGFAVFAYRSFLQKKRANVEISKQKHIIEEKQREILDSIRYAKRIQQSLLPSERNIARLISRSGPGQPTGKG